MLPSSHEPSPANAGSVGAPVGDHPSARSAPTKRLADLSADEWDLMFDAVKRRLRRAVDIPPDWLAGTKGSTDCAEALAIVGECVEALNQLHALLRLERGRDHARRSSD